MSVRKALVAVLGAMTLLALACTPMDPGTTPATTTTTTSGAPLALASASPTSGFAPLVVTFDSTGSSPGSAGNLTYTWNLLEMGSNGLAQWGNLCFGWITQHNLNLHLVTIDLNLLHRLTRYVVGLGVGVHQLAQSSLYILFSDHLTCPILYCCNPLTSALTVYNLNARPRL
jgi:hypothetical protein